MDLINNKKKKVESNLDVIKIEKNKIAKELKEKLQVVVT